MTIRGVTKPLTLSAHFLNRKDFGANWNSVLDRGGVVAGDDVEITIDAEAILDQ